MPRKKELKKRIDNCHNFIQANLASLDEAETRYANLEAASQNLRKLIRNDIWIGRGFSVPVREAVDELGKVLDKQSGS